MTTDELKQGFVDWLDEEESIAITTNDLALTHDDMSQADPRWTECGGSRVETWGGRAVYVFERVQTSKGQPRRDVFAVALAGDAGYLVAVI